LVNSLIEPIDPSAGKVLGRKRIILDRQRIRAMHASGQSVRTIAATVGISKSLVANIVGNQARQ
jgi:hypothetical protein